MMILMVVAFIKAKNTFMYRNIYIFACAPPGGSQISTDYLMWNGAGVTRTELANSNAKKLEIKQGGISNG